MSPIAQIAKRAIEAWSLGRVMRTPAGGTPTAPLFVTLRDPYGELRGCIGHLVPTRKTLEDEVAMIAVLAASRDPRFPPVRPEEVPDLRIEVDVIGPSETVQDLGALDPSRYGVVVWAEGRRGVMLPNVDGVEDAATQVEMARQKAGIEPGGAVNIARFEVTRHE
jgi:AmmeMemoRadiSam system protein A